MKFLFVKKFMLISSYGFGEITRSRVVRAALKTEGADIPALMKRCVICLLFSDFIGPVLL